MDPPYPYQIMYSVIQFIQCIVPSHYCSAVLSAIFVGKRYKEFSECVVKLEGGEVTLRRDRAKENIYKLSLPPAGISCSTLHLLHHHTYHQHHHIGGACSRQHRIGYDRGTRTLGVGEQWRHQRYNQMYRF